MLDIMYEVPFLEGFRHVASREEVINEGKEPELIFEKKNQPDSEFSSKPSIFNGGEGL